MFPTVDPSLHASLRQHSSSSSDFNDQPLVQGAAGQRLNEPDVATSLTINRWAMLKLQFKKQWRKYLQQLKKRWWNELKAEQIEMQIK
ncbi:hypothetical protein ACLKA7_002573 [Drosophila subpalustris]